MKHVKQMIFALACLALVACNGVSTADRYRVASTMYTEISPLAVTAVEIGFEAGEIDIAGVESIMKADSGAYVSLQIAGAAIVAGDDGAAIAAIIETGAHIETLKEVLK